MATKRIIMVLLRFFEMSSIFLQLKAVKYTSWFLLLDSIMFTGVFPKKGGGEFYAVSYDVKERKRNMETLKTNIIVS